MAEVVAVSSVLDEEVEWARQDELYKTFGVTAYSSYTEMLAHPGLTTVVIATSTDVHAENMWMATFSSARGWGHGGQLCLSSTFTTPAHSLHRMSLERETQRISSSRVTSETRLPLYLVYVSKVDASPPILAAWTPPI